MLRRLIVSLALLAGLLALADRGLAIVAGNAVAGAVARSEGLAERPDVSFEGFPFLTQAIGGQFDSVHVVVRDYEREGLRLRQVDATLRDVKVGLGDALSGEVEAVPVGAGEATVTLAYADLNEFLATKPARVRVSASGGVLTASGAVPQVGEVQGRATPTVSGRVVTVRVSDVRRADGTALPAAAAAAAAARLSFTLDLGELPFGISLTSVEVQDDDILVTGSANGIIVRLR